MCNPPNKNNPKPTVPATKTVAGVEPQAATRIAESAGVKSTPSSHPLAEIFPVLDGDRLSVLANDIAAHGLLDEIVLYEGQILDGRCRYLACERAGVSPRFRQYDGSDPLAFVIGRNVHRRHLSKNQRVLAAARAATLPVGSNQVTHSPGLPIGVAAKVFEVSERNVARAKDILRHGTAELCQAVETGKVAVSRAAELCGLPEQEQLAKLRESKGMSSKQTKKRAAAGDENTGGSQFGEVRPSQSPPNEDRNFIIPGHAPRDDDAPYADLLAAWSKAPKLREPRDNEAAYADLFSAWLKASMLVRRRFIEEVIHEF